MLALNLYNEASQFLEERCLKLWEHENNYQNLKRDYAQTKFPITLSHSLHCYDDIIIEFRNEPFNFFTNEYEKALQLSNYSLDKKDADMVLKKMYDISSYRKVGMSYERYEKHIHAEKCLYILRKTPTGYDNNILRIDLFRKIDTENNKRIFTGGLFHALKHFSINDADKGKKHYLYGINDLIHKIFRAFFYGHPNTDSGIASGRYEKSYKNMKVVFYNEENTNISFLKTAHISS